MKNNTTQQNKPGRSLRQLVAQRSMPRTRSFYLLGLGLALAAPLGLPVVEALADGELPTLSAAARDLASYPVTYVYLVLSTLVAVLAVGLLLGRDLARARRLSITDPLTGLFNRRHFGERLTEELSRGKRYRHSTAVLSLDVDRLKQLNDRFGHRAGDHALVAVSRSLAKSLRRTDVVARVGGDEFAALLPETTAHQAQALVRRILEDVARQHEVVGVPLGVSIGIIAVDAWEPAEPAEVLAAADQALYQAKAAGGGKSTLVRLPMARADAPLSPPPAAARSRPRPAALAVEAPRAQTPCQRRFDGLIVAAEGAGPPVTTPPPAPLDANRWRDYLLPLTDSRIEPCPTRETFCRRRASRGSSPPPRSRASRRPASSCCSETWGASS